MTDYLGSLVARTLPSDTGVRPQLLSLFEPSPARIGLNVPVDRAPETSGESLPVAARVVPPPARDLGLSHVDRDAVRDPLPPTPQAASRQQVPPSRDQAEAQLLRVLPRTGPAPDGAAESSAGPRDREVDAVGPLPAGRADDGGRAEVRADHGVSRLPLRPPAPLQPATAAPPAQSTAAIDRVVPPSSSPGPVMASVRRSEAREGALPSLPDHPSLTPKAAVAPDVQPARPVIRPVIPVTQMSPRNLPPAGIASPPSIQVTIGRVEVRAAPSPAARSRPQAPTAPAVTLEDYLRQRATGGPR